MVVSPAQSSSVVALDSTGELHHDILPFPAGACTLLDQIRLILTLMIPAKSIAVSTWPARLIAELDAADRRAKELVDGLTPEQLNWQPAPGVWSIGQCLQHLCMTNEFYVPAIAASLAAKPDSPVREITPGWFGRWFIRKFIEPSPQTRRARAPKVIDPGSRVDSSVLDRFLLGNRAVRELVRKSGDFDVNRIRFPNPFIPLIRFTVGTGLVLIPGHQRRHLSQAERVKQSPNFPH